MTMSHSATVLKTKDGAMFCPKQLALVWDILRWEKCSSTDFSENGLKLITFGHELWKRLIRIRLVNIHKDEAPNRKPLSL